MSRLSVTSSLWEVLGEYLRERPISAGSVGQLRVALNSFERFIARPVPGGPAGATLAQLNRSKLLDWRNARRAAGRRPATINSQVGSLLALWNFAAERGAIAPPPRIRHLVEGLDPPAAWTLEQFGRIVEAARRAPGKIDGVPAALVWEIALAVLWDTACRVGEVFWAEVAEIDLEQRTWSVPAAKRKGGRVGKLYRLHPDTIALIRASLGAPRRWLLPFPSRGAARPIDTFRRRFRRIVQAAGLPADRRHLFHCIRRTAESHAAAARGIAWAAEAVGHGESVARRHYIAPSIVAPPALIDALPRPPAPALRVMSG